MQIHGFRGGGSRVLAALVVRDERGSWQSHASSRRQRRLSRDWLGSSSQRSGERSSQRSGERAVERTGSNARGDDTTCVGFRQGAGLELREAMV